jgi:hypothetical protein
MFSSPNFGGGIISCICKYWRNFFDLNRSVASDLVYPRKFIDSNLLVAIGAIGFPISHENCCLDVVFSNCVREEIYIDARHRTR